MTNTKETHFNGKVAQKAVIEVEGKVLILRDPREKQEIWEIPGGRMNEGEIPEEGLAREIKEELGVDCIVHEIIHLQQFFQTNEGKNALMIVYRATLKNPDVPFALATEEVSEIRFITEADIDNINLFPEYVVTLRKYFANRKQ
jgi:8-oxo-dGTP diphosphatase